MVKKSQATSKTPSKVALAKSLEVPNNQPKSYKLLNKVNEYDHDVVDELVEAQNEIGLLKGRINLLENLIDEHTDLNKFIWKTAEGVNIALHNIDDDHLTNILTHLNQRGAYISKEIRSEAMSRDIPVPVQHVGRASDGDFDDAIREYYQYTQKWGINPGDPKKAKW
jgi:hypothetical protein